MQLYQTRKLLHSKENSHWTEGTAYRMEENLCQLYKESDKGLTARICKGLKN
jgi:hypothetical protein